MESACISAKEIEKEERQVRRVKKRKGIEALRVKYLTPSWASDLIRREEQGAVPQPSYPG